MAAASTLTQVKNYTEAVERALYAAFTRVGGRAKRPRSDEDNDEIWIVPNFQVGPASGHQHIRPDGFQDYDAFVDCMIEWELSCPRLPKTTPEQIAEVYSIFAQEIARILMAMDPANLPFLLGQLPYHSLTRLKPMGILKAYDANSCEDRATVRLRTSLFILPGAWPTDPSAYTNWPA